MQVSLGERLKPLGEQAPGQGAKISKRKERRKLRQAKSAWISPRFPAHESTWIRNQKLRCSLNSQQNQQQVQDQPHVADVGSSCHSSDDETGS